MWYRICRAQSADMQSKGAVPPPNEPFTASVVELSGDWCLVLCTEDTPSAHLDLRMTLLLHPLTILLVDIHEWT